MREGEIVLILIKRMVMKYVFIFAIVMFLSGCQTSSQSVSPSGSTTSSENEARVGDTVLTGKIFQNGSTFSLTDSTGKQTELDSYKVDLKTVVGKEVSVKGQFSGDTLFVAEVVAK